MNIPANSPPGRMYPADTPGLEAAGLPELVTGNLEAYEALALDLATDPQRLSALRARHVAQRQSCMLLDTERYRRRLEAAYTLMWQRVENHLPPIPFAVQDRRKVGA